jgi:hypothetical protein
MAGQREDMLQQDPAAPEKKMMLLIEGDLARVATCAAPPPRWLDEGRRR